MVKDAASVAKLIEDVVSSGRGYGDTRFLPAIKNGYLSMLFSLGAKDKVSDKELIDIEVADRFLTIIGEQDRVKSRADYDSLNSELKSYRQAMGLDGVMLDKYAFTRAESSNPVKSEEFPKVPVYVGGLAFNDIQRDPEMHSKLVSFFGLENYASSLARFREAMKPSDFPKVPIYVGGVDLNQFKNDPRLFSKLFEFFGAKSPYDSKIKPEDFNDFPKK